MIILKVIMVVPLVCLAIMSILSLFIDTTESTRVEEHSKRKSINYDEFKSIVDLSESINCAMSYSDNSKTATVKLSYDIERSLISKIRRLTIELSPRFYLHPVPNPYFSFKIEKKDRRRCFLYYKKYIRKKSENEQATNEQATMLINEMRNFIMKLK